MYFPMSQNAMSWVNGVAGANAFYTPPGCTSWLMDRTEDVFYIKSTDMSGFAMPLRIFDFRERVTQPNQNVNPPMDFVRREDMDKLMAQYAEMNNRYNQLNEQYASLARELGIQNNAEVVHNGQ